MEGVEGEREEGEVLSRGIIGMMKIGEGEAKKEEIREERREKEREKGQ